MSDPRASIQRAVAGPPPRPVSATPSTAVEVVAAAATVTRPIGKPHGRMRCVNLSLSEASATRLRQLVAEQGLTLGEVLMELVQTAVVPHTGRRSGRSPVLRRSSRLTNVYALLTPAESADLSERAVRAGRSVSDYADRVLSGA